MPVGGCRASCEHAMSRLILTFNFNLRSKNIPAGLSSESGIFPRTQASLKSPVQCNSLGCAQYAPRCVQTLIELLGIRFFSPHSPGRLQNLLIRHCPYSEFPSKSSPWATMLLPRWAIGRVFSLSSPSLRLEIALT